MARPIVVTQFGTGSSPWAVIDHHINPVNIGVACVVSGTANYTVEYTYDNIENSGFSPTVFPHGTLVALTATTDGNFTLPVYAIRVTINSGTGSVAMTLVQSGIHS